MIGWIWGQLALQGKGTRGRADAGSKYMMTIILDHVAFSRIVLPAAFSFNSVKSSATFFSDSRWVEYLFR